MNMKHAATGCLVALLALGAAEPVWSEESDDTWEKLVFHVDEMANARWSLMLARSYLDDSPKAKIVFVVYGPGIDFLMDDAKDRRGNPFDPAVLNLIDKGVEFRAYANALQD